MNKASSAEDYKLISSFESVRKTLLDERYADRLERPLAFWALPNDRRLPLAFLGRTLADLLNTPFADLTATPGIGQKKISSLVKLLHRATQQQPPNSPLGIEEPTAGSAEKAADNLSSEAVGRFEPSLVSEALWLQWRQTVRTWDLGPERLGRLAPSLAALPTVIWHTPLSQYLDFTLAEIRQFKTHGEKRIRVMLEVFYVVHEILSRAGTPGHLAVRLTPAFAIALERWLADCLEQATPPTLEEVRKHLVVPLLAQIRHDTDESVFALAEGRLGIHGPPQSVRQQSRQMSVTRARVYQLLDECSKVMEVRWSEGRGQLIDAIERFRAQGIDPEALHLLQATRELLFPEKFERLDEEELPANAVEVGF